MRKQDIWIVIPAHNEARHIGDVVRQVRENGYANVVVVDDGSKDATSTLATRAGAITIRHIMNLHKGAAMRTGAEYALSQGAKALVFLDGDGQHHPSELDMFKAQLDTGNDLVLGARRVTKNMPLVRKLGKLLTFMSVKLLYRMDAHDVLSGYRALTAAAYRKVEWTSNDYKVESEMIARAGKAKLKYSEITVSTIYHDKYKGVTFIDGIGILWRLLLWRVTLRRR